jgi:hypothetical protein
MDSLLKTNLANLFRKQEALRVIEEFDIKEQAVQARSNLKSKLNPFLVDGKYALKLDEII